ncbi:MAG: hypothetical protein V3T83_16940 [Acidobacteriota bacterium]
MVTSQDNHGKDDVAFVLEDSCAHGHEPIRVEVKNGEIVSLSPDTLWVQQGGG